MPQGPHPRRDGRPTFVLLHGLHGNSSTWSPVLRQLALLGHRALAVDLPGHGMDASFPLSYQAPQDLEAFSAQPSPSSTRSPETAHRTIAESAEAHPECASTTG